MVTPVDVRRNPLTPALSPFGGERETEARAGNLTLRFSYALCLWTTTTLLLAAGCSSPNVNPPQARPNTGYIDFYSPTDGELCWEIGESKNSDSDFRIVFSDVKPVEGDRLRLAFSPGPHRLRVTFLNRVISAPAVFNCNMRAGKIVPVAISLTPAGQTTVVSKQTTMGGTQGRSGRQTKINRQETVRYDLSADVGQAFPYQPKSQINYPNQPR